MKQTLAQTTVSRLTQSGRRIYRIAGDLMKSSKMDNKPRIGLGFIAGLAGGLAGTAAMIIAERIRAPREADEKLSSDNFGESVELLPLNCQGGRTDGRAIHWVFGAVAGGVYGVMAEVSPRVTESKGAVVAAMINFATHDSTLQAIGVAPPPGRSMQADGRDLSKYAVYGIAAEFVRKHARRVLERRHLKQMTQAERRSVSNVNFKQPA